MVKKTIIGIFAAAVLMALSMIALGAWVLMTPSGTRWALEQLETRVAVVSFGQINGRLLGELGISELSLISEGRRIQARQIELNSAIESVLSAAWSVERLQVEDLKIALLEPGSRKARAGFSWPGVPELPAWINLRVNELFVGPIRVSHAGELPLRLEQVAGTLDVTAGVVSLQKLDIRHTRGRLSGELRFSTLEKTLDSRLKLDLSGPQNQSAVAQIILDLGPASPDAGFSGTAAMELSLPHAGLFKARLEVSSTPQGVRLHDLQARQQGRAGSLSGSGLWSTSGAVTSELNLTLNQLDLTPELNRNLQVSGDIWVRGQPQNYRGRFALDSSGEALLRAELRGRFSGDLRHLQLEELAGRGAGSSLRGEAQVNWQGPPAVDFQLRLVDLDPQFWHEALQGSLHADLQGSLKVLRSSWRGEYALVLRKSHLQGQPVNGYARGYITPDKLMLDAFQLDGPGFQVQASGSLRQQLDVDLRIARLEHLLSGAGGSLEGRGRFRLRNGVPDLSWDLEGRQLSYRSWAIRAVVGQGTLSAADHIWSAEVSAEGLSLPHESIDEIDRVTFTLSGRMNSHRIGLLAQDTNQRLKSEFEGAWDHQGWQGRWINMELSSSGLGSWRLTAPAVLKLSPTMLSLETAQLISDAEAVVELEGAYQPPTGQVTAAVIWQRFDPVLLQPWLSGIAVAGTSSGEVRLLRNHRSHLQADFAFDGRASSDSWPHVELRRIEASLDWHPSGLSLALDTVEQGGAQLAVRIQSSDPPDLWPRVMLEEADVTWSLSDLPLQLFKPWLPKGLDIRAVISGDGALQWRHGTLQSAEGQLTTSGGRLSGQDVPEEINTDFGRSRMSWHWRDRLQLAAELDWAPQGSIAANLAVEQAAGWPLPRIADQALSGTVKGRFSDRNLAAALWPNQLRSSHGEISAQLQLGGRLANPEWSGELQLSEGGLVLLDPGLELTDIQVNGILEGQKLRVPEFTLTSGGGRLTGHGWIHFSGWIPDRVNIALSGTDVLIINRPDLQATGSPDLQLLYEPGQMVLRGEIRLPEVNYHGRDHHQLARNSPDLVIVDGDRGALRKSPVEMNIDLRIILGDQVLVKHSGLDARLDGELRIAAEDLQHLQTTGTLRVVKGRFSRYGVNLDIEQGVVLFSGGAPQQAALDILALRGLAAEDVRVGVRVTGTPRQPQVALYSEPAMSDTDILSYIILGRSLDSGSGEDADLLLSAAGALLSQGESATLQEKVKSRLGLDVLRFSAGQGDLNEARLVTGKYLSPDLYVSMGYSLFTHTNRFQIRYHLTPHWDIESQIGRESGVDLFYRFEIGRSKGSGDTASSDQEGH